MRRRSIAAVVAAAVGLFAIAAGAKAFLRRQVLFPAPATAVTPGLFGGLELWRLPSPGRPEVLALYRPADPGWPTLVYFHGNGDQLADTLLLAVQFGAQGLGFLAVEYPGYGLAAGEPNESSLYAAAEVALAHLHQDRAVPLADTVLSGHSLGCGVATEMAKRGLGAKLVLLAPFGSVIERGSATYPHFLVEALLGALVDDRFDNAAKAPQIQLPVFVLHGDSDEVIPLAEGRALAYRFPDAKFLVLPGAHHNDLFRNRALGVADQIVAFALEGRKAEAQDVLPDP